MKSLTFAIACAICLIVATPVSAQTPTKPIVSTSATVSTSAIPFTLVLLGTRHYTDIDALTGSLKQLKPMRQFIPLRESQNQIVYSGRFAGTTDALMADITSLAANRFDLQTRTDRRDGFIITLRKITSPPEATPTE